MRNTHAASSASFFGQHSDYKCDCGCLTTLSPARAVPVRARLRLASFAVTHCLLHGRELRLAMFGLDGKAGVGLHFPEFSARRVELLLTPLNVYDAG